METYSVKPKEPTICHGKTHHPLKGLDLMAGFRVDAAHIVPGPIDIDRFNDAVARTLSVYPVYAGRLQRPSDISEPWRIRLTNDAVPVNVITSDADPEASSNAVIQAPFTLTRPVNILKYMEENSEEPFLSLTVVRFTKTGSTSVGLSSSHLIGDGFLVGQFARLLSQNYQGLPSLDPPPTYDPTPAYPFNPADYGDIPVPDLQHFYPYRETAPHLEPTRKKPIRADFRLTAEQIAQIQKGVMGLCTDGKPAAISKQDAVVALLAYCVSKSDPDTLPVQHVCTFVMNRGIPPRSVTAVGNGLMWAMTDAADDFERETPFTIALRVRKSLIRLRDPGYAAAYEAKGAKIAREALDAGMFQDFIPRPGYMVINSTWRFDFHSAHFGYPGKTRFFQTVLNEPRYVKMFQPNPTRLSDGTWRTRWDDIEVAIYVHREIKPAFMEYLASEARKLGMQGEVEWVPNV